MAIKIEKRSQNNMARPLIQEMYLLKLISRSNQSIHLPKIYGDGNWNNNQYMKMEYFDYSLEDYLALPDRNSKLTIEEIGV